MVKINSVMHGSPSDKCGVKKDDILVKINGHGIKDVLDYMYYAADTEVSLELLRGNETINLDISKDEYDDLGLEFETFLMDSKQSCSNKCVFCFIDQMPPGMRETLYFKDDDARLSFLQGNYVTLTNLHQEDIDRIIEMKLNINVSVHTTNPELRVKMMHNRFAGEKLKYIWQLAESGIKLNCQIVCCPGLNDGDELRRSLTDLGTLMPNITSMAVVPVGLTKFRKGLYPLVGFTKETAGETIDIIEEFQQVFLEKFGTRTVFPSDEFYLIAERELPPMEAYEDFSQYESGKLIDMNIPLKFHFPKKMNFTEAGSAHIYYSDVDMNRHMNNTNYPNLVWRYIPGVEGKEVTSINIRFMKEAPLGSDLKITMTAADPEMGKDPRAEELFAFRTEINGQTNVEALLGVRKTNVLLENLIAADAAVRTDH